MADGELSLIDKDISSLSEVPLRPAVKSLNLHCNRISKIEGLTGAWYLRHLDLSSNRISRIEGLSSLAFLRTLNLSCNLIAKLDGLNGLVNLTRLNVSYNQIGSLTGLLYLHGAEYKLKHLSLHSNRLDSINHLLQCMLGVQSLREVTLSLDGTDNPICSLPGYREMVVQSLPQISILDGMDRLGNPAPLGEDSPGDIPGLEDYMEFLVSSDTSANNLTGDHTLATPRIDEVLSQFRQQTGPGELTDAVLQSLRSRPGGPSVVVSTADPVNEQRIKKLEHQVSRLFHQATAAGVSSSPAPSVVTVQKPERDIDDTSESRCNSGKENRRHSRIPTQRSATATLRRANKETKARKADSDRESPKRDGAKCGGRTVVPRGVDGSPSRSTKAPGERSTKPTVEEETYRTIVGERDQERERRWKAEQAVRRLMEQMKGLETRASEEKDLQSLALHTTDRLKELLLKEHSERSGLETRVEELEGRSRSLTQQLKEACGTEEQHKRALRSLEDGVSHSEALRARQQAEEMQRHQELEKRSAALRREADIQKASVRQHRDKLQQMHQLLASREQEHKKQLESRLTPGGAEFREAVANEVASAERRHAQREAELEERMAECRERYAALEDEFRMALTIEATRFSEVKEACVQLGGKQSELKAALGQSQQRDRQSSSLVQELTAMVKEQKTRIAELIKAKREAVADLKGRLRTLEGEAEQDRRLGLQLELLKRDKSGLLSQLTAHESMVDGLRAERRIWGQELAQQGVSLAQDRGRLEARVELLGTELETQKKQNERDSDALRIKAKIIDDQTDTIRKLKEAVQERDEQLRRLREDALQAQRRFQQQLEEEAGPVAELTEQVDLLSLRKAELKQQLEDKEVELQDVKEVHSASSKKWQQKAELLTRLESQVMRMKDNFDSKETLLLEERDTATQAHKAAVEKLHSVDDAFRRQRGSLQASHQAELLRLANDTQRRIEEANQRASEVEEEMRQLLEETETNKRIVEEKMRRLTSVLHDFE